MQHWRTCWHRTSFDPYTLDPAFLKRLYRFDDGRVRLRWSGDRQKWSVERKMVRTVEYVHNIPEYIKRYYAATNTWELVPNETYITARDGYLVIDYVDPKPAPKDWIIYNLQINDIRRWGGAKKVLEKIEAMEKARDEKKEELRRDELYNVASESYDHLKRRYGQQVFIPKNYKFGDKLK